MVSLLRSQWASMSLICSEMEVLSSVSWPLSDRWLPSSPSLAACAASSKSRVCLYSARRLTSQRQSFGGQTIHADTGLGGVHRQSAVGLRWDAQSKRSTVATRG